MKIVYSSSFFAGVLATALCVSPPPMEAKAFGYVGLKSGYSNETFSKTTITAPNTNLSTQFQSSSAFGIPLGLDLGFGYYITPSIGFRLELEYLYRFGGKFKDDVWKYQNPTAAPDITIKHQAEISNILGNVYLDYYIIPSLYIYVGGGVGASIPNTTITWRNTNDNTNGKVSSLKEVSLAWQVGGGIGMYIWKNLGLDVNVRYMGLGNAKLRAKGGLNAVGDLPYTTLDVLAELRYRF